MDNELYDKVLNGLQAQCVKRECCASDIRRKALKAFGGDEDAADWAVSSLIADKFVDNLRYASAFAREKSSLTGWGEQKISFALAGKGIDRQIVAEALKEIDCDAADRKLEAVVAAKYRTLADDPSCRLKLFRFALSRGYTYDQVRDVVERIMSPENGNG